MSWWCSTTRMRRFDYYRLLERVNVGEAEVAEIGASSEEFDNHYAVSDIWNAREVPTMKPIRRRPGG